MHNAPIRPTAAKELRRVLSDPSAFRQMADHFITKAAEEKEDFEGFRTYFATAMRAHTEVTADEIDAAAKSPIERIFLRSLLLSFIKNDGLGLVVHPTFKDAAAEVADFRVTLDRLAEFRAWFRENHPGGDVAKFLDDETARGKIGVEERAYYTGLLAKYYYVPLNGSYHMSLQPRFAGISPGGGVLRPDIYLWIPARPEINVIVECDGFAFHSDKEAFTRDRRRDRSLKAAGYDVLRFSGSEIYSDPANTAHELAEYLWSRSATPSVPVGGRLD